MKFTEVIGGRVTPDVKARLAAALKTLKRTEGQAIREAVDFYLPEIEAEAEAVLAHRHKRKSR